MTQTVTLTQPVRVGGSVLAAGTTQTFARDIAADLVERGFATPVGIPAWQQTGGQMSRVVAQSNIPFLIMPGDGGSNGCTFTGTAGAFTLSAAILASTGGLLAGCYAYFSANFGGSTLPAGWYWTEFSDDTNGIVYAGTYTSGMPRRLATKTPIGVNLTGRITATTNEVTGPNGFLLPENTLGRNGRMRFAAHLSGSTSSTKSIRLRDVASAATMFSFSTTTSPVSEFLAELVCLDSNTIKVTHRSFGLVSTSSNGVPFNTVDSSIARTLQVTLQQTANTAGAILAAFSLEAAYGE